MFSKCLTPRPWTPLIAGHSSTNLLKVIQIVIQTYLTFRKYMMDLTFSEKPNKTKHCSGQYNSVTRPWNGIHQHKWVMVISQLQILPKQENYSATNAKNTKNIYWISATKNIKPTVTRMNTRRRSSWNKSLIKRHSNVTKNNMVAGNNIIKYRNQQLHEVLWFPASLKKSEKTQLVTTAILGREHYRFFKQSIQYCRCNKK